MISVARYDLLLALYPNTRGFAFVLFEGPFSPVDWRVVEVRGADKNGTCIRRIEQLLDCHRPDLLLLEDMSWRGSRRARRIRILNELIADLADRYGVPFKQYSRAQVRDRFAHIGYSTRYTIAEFIARHIAVFRLLLPPPRKIWKSEDARMGIFDAAALGMTFFYDVASGAGYPAPS